MNRSKEPRPESKSDADEPSRADREKNDETENGTDPATPPIDEDFAGSVNAALHETDE